MGDPLSLSLAILGLVGTAETVVVQGWELIKAVKGAKENIAKLLQEVTALYGVLRSLELVSSRFEKQEFDTTVQTKTVESCKALLIKMRDKLNHALPREVDGRLRGFGKSLKWPFSTAETMELIQEVERHKNQMSLALNVNSIDALLTVLANQASMEDVQNNIRNDITQLKTDFKARSEREEARAHSKAARKVLDTLTKVDTSHQHISAIRQRHPGTGLWFIDGDAFDSWLNGNSTALWLTGIRHESAGAGKTVLTSTIIGTLQSRIASKPEEALVYFYCDYKSLETQEPYTIMQSLIRKLAVQHESSLTALQNFVESLKKDRKDLSVLDLENLTELFIKLSNHFDHVFVVVDALDECLDTRANVLQLLAGLQLHVSKHVKLLYTSRNELDIREALSSFTEVSIAANSSDLELYVTGTIEDRIRKNRLRNIFPETKADIISTLKDKAEGMFRWAACQLDYLCELPNDTARREALPLLPEGIYNTYKEILRRLRKRSEYTQNLVEWALKWLLGSERLLKFTELCDALAISAGKSFRDKYAISTADEILLQCGSFTRKNAEGNGMELAHFTVKEFLTSNELHNDSSKPSLQRFYFSESEASLELAGKCLSYVQYDDFAMKSLKMQHVLEAYPFYEYAASYWYRHAANLCLNTENLFEVAKQFFDPLISTQFRLWSSWQCLQKDNTYYPGELEAMEPVHILDPLYNNIAPIHWAATLGFPDLFQWLLEQGEDKNASSYLGTPLECVIDCGYLGLDREKSFTQIANTLVTEGAEVNQPSKRSENSTILTQSIQRSDSQLMCILLRAGALVDESCLEELCSRFLGKSRYQPIAEEFMNNVTLVNVPEHLRHQFAEIQLLSDANEEQGLANIRPDNLFLQLSSDYGALIRVYASDGNLGNLQRVLASAPSLINEPYPGDGSCALHFACVSGHANCVNFLLERGADANARNHAKEMPLHVCLKNNGNLEVLKALIRRHADTAAINGKGENCLHVAAKTEYAEALKYLLATEYPIDCLEAKTNEDNSILHCAALSNSERMLAIVLDHHTPPDYFCRNHDDETCLHIAVRQNSKSSAELFVKKGLLNEADSKGLTALHIALSKRHMDLVAFLLLSGSSVSIAELNGMTALHHIAVLGSIELWQLASRLETFPTALRMVAERGTVLRCIVEEEDEPENRCEMLKALATRADVSLNGINPEGQTAIVQLAEELSTAGEKYYAKDQRIKLILCLIQLGCDLTLQDSKGNSLLHYLFNCTVTSQIVDLAETALAPHPEILEIHNHNGETAVDVVLLRCMKMEASKVTAEVSRLLNLLLPLLSDREVNEPTKGLLRPIVVLLKLQLTKLALLLVPRITRPELSLTDDLNALSPLEAVCVYSGNSEIFKQLASMSSDLEYQSKSGNRIIHWASGWNRLEILQYLLDRKVKVDPVNAQGKTPLNLAVESNSIELVKLLLKHGANSMHVSLGGRTPWHSACITGSPVLFDTLRDYTLEVDLERTDQSGLSPLLLAAEMGNENATRKLLDMGASAVAVDNENNTSLHYAAQSGYTSILKLLHHSAPQLSLDTVNMKGETPLMHAVTQGQFDAISFLVENDARLEAVDDLGQSLLHHVALKGQHLLFQILQLKYDSLDIDVRSSNDSTPLLLAAKSGHMHIVDELIDAGADVTAHDDSGRGILHLAAEQGHNNLLVDVLQRFAKKLDVNEPTLSSHRTPLHLALVKGFTPVIGTLIEAGANPNLAAARGMTAIHIAADRLGKTTLQALFSATEKNNVSMNIDAKDDQGRTALMIARTKPGGKRSAELLLEKGAQESVPSS